MTYEQPQRAPQAPYVSPMYAPPVAAPMSGLAVAAFVCSLVAPASGILAALSGAFIILAGLLGLMAPIATLLALILGHIAFVRTKRRGLRGRGLALAAIIIGWILVVTAIIAAIAIGGFIIAIISGADGYSAG